MKYFFYRSASRNALQRKNQDPFFTTGGENAFFRNQEQEQQSSSDPFFSLNSPSAYTSNTPSVQAKCADCEKEIVYTLDDLDGYEDEIHMILHEIDDCGPAFYGGGCLGLVKVGVHVPCKECDGTIYITVGVTADICYEDDDSDNERMPQIESFENITVNQILPQHTAPNGSLLDSGPFDPDDYEELEYFELKEFEPENFAVAERSVTLTIIVKTRMNDGICYLGLSEEGEILRPITTTKEQQCCWESLEFELDHIYKFNILASRPIEQIPLPHRQNDVLVSTSTVEKV
ncbi:MAG: hypothetical protein AAF682_07790, partial [Planctomycetota bacterium]